MIEINIVKKNVIKEWGTEEWIRNDDRYCMKELAINPGYRCSMHMHKLETETFYVVKGIVDMEVGERKFMMMSGDHVHIPKGVYHRFSSPSRESAIVLECSTQHFEDDSYRKVASGRIPRYGDEEVGNGKA